MSDSEVRRSRRTNKGVNTRLANELKLEEELAAVNNHPTKKPNGNKKTKAKDKNQEVVRCLVCGTIDSNYDEDLDDKGLMIQCEKCETWQHAKCVFDTTNQRKLPKVYVCFTCDPAYDERYVGIEDRSVLKYSDYIKGLNASDDPASESDRQEEDNKASDDEEQEEQEEEFEEVVKTKKKRSVVTKPNKPDPEEKSNKTRDSVINQFSKKFTSPVKNDDKSTLAKCNKLSVDLEKEIFQLYNKEISNDYLTKVRSLLFNISNTKIPIIERLISDEVSVSELVNYTKEDFMNEEERQKLKDMLQKSINQVVLVNENQEDSSNGGMRIKRTHKGEEVIEMNDELFHSGIIDKEKEKEEVLRAKRQKLELTKQEMDQESHRGSTKEQEKEGEEEDEEGVEKAEGEKKEEGVKVTKKDVAEVHDSNKQLDFNVNLLTNYRKNDHNDSEDEEERRERREGEEEEGEGEGFENKELKDDLLDGIIDDTFVTKEEEKPSVTAIEAQKEELESSDEFYDPESIGMNQIDLQIFQCRLKLIGISEFPIAISFIRNNNSSIGLSDNLTNSKEFFKILSNYNVGDTTDELNIEGRLDYDKCESYLRQIKQTRDLLIFQVKPDLSDDELNNELVTSLYYKMINYFTKRDKVGVINTKRNEVIKDAYLINKKQSLNLIDEVFGGDDGIDGELLIVLVIKKGLSNFSSDNELNNLLNVLN